MKHAVLIMAHKNKEQLIRLIKTLACDSFDFFVHPDIEWKLSDEELKEISACAPNVFITKNRIHGILDNWALPQISLNLIDDAVVNENRIGIKYNYFILLSGQDYPIKSNEYILDFLEKQYPKPLIDEDPYRDGNWVATKFMLVRWSHKIDEIHDKYKPGIIRKFRVAPYVIAEICEKLFYGTPYQRVSKFGYKLYGGSAWWILPNEVVSYINEVRKTNPRFIEEYKRTWTPEETFFQTMAENSPLADMIDREDDIYEKGDQACMTYANFVTPTKSFRGHPHTICLEDFDRIMAKKQLFARKFDLELSNEALEMIDAKRKSEKSN